ncbi:hypothetical protein [Clostridium frigidicarnis]|uniref:Coenzyme PQQ synthesis protein D (PqqD) n=1 Tax=Clostridium frigidicarnis TaxID=84698 RepID=A0A1I0ZY93_9CLOT|nr:hypothetical protein [Clostridium frigidicarnis]SFB30591.1 hypothetical protein SAMN04488528_102728 [Clostridium frigidicarnis]
MEFQNQQLVKWECNNWYIREDKLIQICTQDGGSVILNPVFSNIWVNINYEITLEELWNKVKDSVTWNQFENTIEELKLYNLIYIIDVEDEFNLIFG